VSESIKGEGLWWNKFHQTAVFLDVLQCSAVSVISALLRWIYRQLCSLEVLTTTYHGKTSWHIPHLNRNVDGYKNLIFHKMDVICNFQHKKSKLGLYIIKSNLCHRYIVLWLNYVKKRFMLYPWLHVENLT
jgi:hypothetical protein